MRHNHNLPTYAAFFNLVKTVDTVNHEILTDILDCYGNPPKLRSSISRMYTDLKVVLKIGKLKHSFEKTVGVQQCECMAPVLLLLLVMAFSETLEE